MDIFSLYQTDTAKENQGIWFELGDARFLIARTGNQKSSELYTQLRAKNKARLAVKAQEEEVTEEILIELYAKTILLNWEGVTKDGAPWPYSVENAKEALKLRDFRDIIFGWAGDYTNFKAQNDEEDSKP